MDKERRLKLVLCLSQKMEFSQEEEMALMREKGKNKTMKRTRGHIFFFGHYDEILHFEGAIILSMGGTRNYFLGG